MSGLVFACFVLGGLTPGPLPPVDPQPPIIPLPPVDPPVDPQPPVDPPGEPPVDPPGEPPVDPPVDPQPPVDPPVDSPVEPPVDPPVEPPVDPPVVPQVTDYCQTSYCAAGLTNVGCNPPPLTGGPQCTKWNPVFHELTPSDINDFLDMLNSIRSKQVSGAYADLPTARRMPTLQWDEELATLAGHNTRGCYFTHDNCRNTAKYSNVGQMVITTYDFDNKGIYEVITADTDEICRNNYPYPDCNPMSYTDSCSNMEPLFNIINDRSTRVGCATMTYDFYMFELSYTVCNYSDNVVSGVPVYTKGSLGSGCTKMNPKYPSLCSVDEVF